VLSILSGDALPSLYCNHLQFLLVFLSFFFSIYRACSTGFKSNDWLDRSRISHFLALRNSCVALAICLGSLSCYRMKSCPMGLEAFTGT